MGAAPDYDVFLLTRFAIRWDRYQTKCVDDAWLRRRVELFERWTLPSVQAQRFKRFQWWLLIERDVPAWFRKRAAGWPATLTEMPSGRELWSVKIDRMVKRATTTPWTLVARLDSDDCLAATYFSSAVQALATLPRERRWLIHQHGYWHTPKVCHLGNYRWRQFPFLFERSDVHGGVFQCEHGFIKRHGKVVELPDPGWLTVVHGGNARNSPVLLRTGRPATLEELRRDFPTLPWP